MTTDAFHLPALRDDEVAEWQHFDAGTEVLRAPLLTPVGLDRIVHLLRAAQLRLHDVPIEHVIHTIDAVAARLGDERDELRITAASLLPAVTGYTPAMIRLILNRMAADWRRPALVRLLDAELGGADMLERPVTRAGRTAMAVPYPLVTHVFAGNIPGVAVTSLVRALLVRSASLGKAASGEPLLAALFARAIAEQDPIMGAALAVTYWPGGSHDLEQVAFGAADAVVVYGGAEALADIRRRAPPHVALLDHGPRLSVGFVARTALHDEARARTVAADAARAIATFDQQGCVSPHALYVEDGEIDAQRFAALLVDALASMQDELPRGALSSDEAAAIRVVTTRAEFGATAPPQTTLVSPPDAPFTVLFHAAPDFETSCLHRTIHVYRVARLDDALHALAPYRPLLQSAAIAGTDAALQHRLARSGFTRITSFSRMPWPDPAAHHDGRGPLTELIRFVAAEEP